jgi:methyl-accepting chemotaxis protein
MAAAAEQLSANAEEVKSASGQISSAIEEISRSAQQSAKACETAMALGTRLEAGAKDMGVKASQNVEKCTRVTDVLATNKEALDSMIANIGQAARPRMCSSWKSAPGASTRSWIRS